MTNTENLIRFIKSHGNEAYEHDGSIVARVEWVDREGNVGADWETIPSTLGAVRNWLGY